MNDFLSRYELPDRLGTGGMGAVWRARDMRNGRIVAVKVLHPHLAADREYVRRFEREARITASIDSPNIIRVFDFGQDGGSFFLVMEYLEGRTLAEVIRSQGKLSVAQAVSIAQGIVSALADAHKRGVIHRDVKPQNVMIAADGSVKVADFGIARAVGHTAMTSTGVFLGTPSYMAPETVSSRTTDTRADIYAVGSVLYEMLTGSVPFAAETPWAVIGLHERATPPSLRQTRSETPAWLVGVYERCLEKRPEDRFETPQELLVALVRGERGYAPQAAPHGNREARVQWRVLAAAGTSAIAIVGAVLALTLTDPTDGAADDRNAAVLPSTTSPPDSPVPSETIPAGGGTDGGGELLAAISDLFVEVPGPVASDYKLHTAVEVARGCAERPQSSLSRDGNQFNVVVTVEGTGECTSDFTPHSMEIDLGDDIEPGVKYAVAVNGTTIWFDGVEVQSTTTATAPTTKPEGTPSVPIVSCAATDFTVYASQDWQDTGIRGETVTSITYISGNWTVNVRNVDSIDPYTDADGYPGKRLLYTPLTDENLGGLIGRAGMSHPFWVGNDFSNGLIGEGNLQLRINDEDYLNPIQVGLQDNEGSILVSVRHC